MIVKKFIVIVAIDMIEIYLIKYEEDVIMIIRLTGKESKELEYHF